MQDDQPTVDVPATSAARVPARLTTRRPKAEDALLRKPNEAIAIRPKKGRLTLLTRRIYNALLYHAQQQGGGKGPFTLPLSKLIEDAHFNSKNFSLFKEHIREMQSTVIDWYSTGQVGRRWISAQLLGPVSIEEFGPGYPVILSWNFASEELSDSLLKPSRYTKFLLDIGGDMRSYAASVLFELGMQYLTSPSRVTMREDVLWWGSVLTGRSDVETVDYRYFKRDVITPALAEVHALQDDFTLELIEYKQGRRVAELQFRIDRKRQRGLGVTEPRNTFDLQLVERMRKIGLSQEEADGAYAKNDEALLRSTLDHVEQRMRSATLPALGSAPAYFWDALKKGYAAGAAEERIAPPVSSDESAEMPRLAFRTSVESIREEWQRARAREAQQLFEALPADEQQAHALRFEGTELAGLIVPIARAWSKDGPRSKIAGPVFFRWLSLQNGREPSDGELLAFAVDGGKLPRA